MKFFFSTKSPSIKSSAIYDGTSLGIIKPHIVKEKKLGAILQCIVDEGFKITAIKMIHLDRVQCDEFYEIYKGVVQEYVVSFFYENEPLYTFFPPNSLCLLLYVANGLGTM